MLRTLIPHKADRLFTPEVVQLVKALEDRFGARRLEVLQLGEARRAELRTGHIAPLETTAAIRQGDWQAAPVPEQLLERRVELIGGGSRKELIDGLNAGAKSYVADLWGMTPNTPSAILRAHKNIERAATLNLAYVDADGNRVRINPGSTTRLMVAPRPLHAQDHTLEGPAGCHVATFVDLAILICLSGEKLRQRQGGIFLYLRELGGHEEARLWDDLLLFLESHQAMPPGTIRATVVMDNLAAVLDADEILHGLRQHAAGLAFDPQGFAADHVALFSAKDRPVMPDREHIGLNAEFLRAASLRTIAIAHRRNVHAIGAPAFVLPVDAANSIAPRYLEMIADKEREAVDGHDGTLVAHPGLVNAAMAEFNKSMPKAHQIYYKRQLSPDMGELMRHPQGALTTEGMQRSIRTVIKALVEYPHHQGLVVQGGRLHDRSSIRLATALLWHWTQSNVCFITGTGLEIHAEVVKYLIRKEGEKLYAAQGPDLRERAKQAVQLLTRAVLAPEVPADLPDVPIFGADGQ